MEYSVPRYLKIAVNISERIASGNILEGSKLKGRSVLSTEYNVSSETIRRAMSLLSDKNVVKTANGKDNVVLSKENAIAFIKSFDSHGIIKNLRLNLSQAYEKKLLIEQEIYSLTDQIIDMYKYRSSDLIKPIEIQLPPNCHMIGKSIKTLEIWHNTGATVVGVIREQEAIVSPGPYFEFSENDIIIIVGDKNVVECFNAFINGIIS